MKKKNLLFASAIYLALSPVLTSCSSSEDTGSNVITNVVKTDAEATALVNGAYGPLQRLSSSFSFIIETQTDHLISFEGEENEAGPVVSRFEQTPDTWYDVKIFNYLYKSIGVDNDAINRISNSTDVSESTKNATIGKAKLLRALSYSYLVQLWGEVPLVTEKDSTTTTRASIDDVYTQIVSDLEDAESLLTDYDASPINPSKLVADALLARVYLNWGNNPLSQSQVEAIVDSKTDPAKSYNTSRLSKAVEYADKVINSGKYSLLTDYAKIFGRANESKAPEHILTIRHDGDAVDAQGNHQTHCGWTFPFQLQTQNHLESADVTLLKEWAVSDPDDSVRRNFSYRTNIYNPEDDSTYTYAAPNYTPILGKAVDQTWENSVNLEITLNDIDRIDMRYPEVLLIKAEALVEQGKNTEAAGPINEVRRRAYGDTKHDLTTVTFNDIKKEWNHEFVYEQKHLLNLYRWKELISTVQRVKDFEHFDDSYATTGNTGRDGSIVNAFFAKVHKHLVAKYNNVKGKFYRQPIPTGLSGEDLGITPQNPGY